ncbi:TraR/DksA C4-type zinc finger protein [Yersinia sp. 2538 StPb PI]|uniref:TraR/DksA C4-type zinc finger protein n=1 Tax=Yersinia sp. 2538 StPb PI TaxID=3117405 RepID=UPI003FA4C1FB
MPDIADVAQEYTDIQLNQALTKIRAPLKTPSLSICQHCNAPIPPARQALGGVTTCVTCQERVEFTHRIVLAGHNRR